MVMIMNKKIIYCVVLAVTILFAMGSVNAGIFDFLGGGETTIKIGYVPSDHDAALFVADANGYFKDEGFNVDLIKFNNGNELMKAIETNEIDVGYVGIVPVLNSIGSGSNSKIISSAQNEGSGIVVSDSEITQPSGLKGKSIAIPGKGSIQEILLSNYLDKNGMSIKDLNVSYIKASSMNDSLKNSKIDGVITFQPYVSITGSNGNNILANSSEILPNHPCCVVVGSSKFINDNHDNAKKFVSIHENATKFINDNIAQGNVAKIVEMLPNEIVEDKELEMDSLKSFPFTSGIDSNFKSNVLTFQQIGVEKGIIKNQLAEDQIFWEA